VGPAAPGGGDGAAFVVGLGDGEEGGGIEAAVAEQFGREPEVLAGVGGEAFQGDGVLGDAAVEQDVGDGVGLGGGVAAVVNGAAGLARVRISLAA